MRAVDCSDFTTNATQEAIRDSYDIAAFALTGQRHVINAGTSMPSNIISFLSCHFKVRRKSCLARPHLAYYSSTQPLKDRQHRHRRSEFDDEGLSNQSVERGTEAFCGCRICFRIPTARLLMGSHAGWRDLKIHLLRSHYGIEA